MTPILKVMSEKRILLAFVIVLILTSGFAYGQEVAISRPGVETKSVYELIKMYQARQPEDGFSLPSQLSFLTSARINLHVGTETVGMVVGDGKIIEVVKEGVKDPTIEFKTSRKYFNTIVTSQRPLKRIKFGLGQGFIVKRDHGIKGKVTGELLKRAIEKLDTPEPKVTKRVFKKLASISEKRGGRFVIEGPRAGLSRTTLELSGGEGLADQTVEIEEFTGYVDEAPSGIKGMSLGEGEKNLGIYVKIEVGEEKTDDVLLKIAYSEEELDYNFLDEDSLTIKWLDEESGKWHNLRADKPNWVKEVGINKEENYVFARLEHASVYAVAGSVINVKRLEEQRGYEPAYFESIEEVEKIRETEGRKGIIDRIVDFVLGLFL